jgi:hypothetical protein
MVHNAPSDVTDAIENGTSETQDLKSRTARLLRKEYAYAEPLSQW